MIEPGPKTKGLGILWVCAPNVAHVSTGGKKWPEKTKSERNDIEHVSFHYWPRLDELIILA